MYYINIAIRKKPDGEYTVQTIARNEDFDAIERWLGVVERVLPSTVGSCGLGVGRWNFIADGPRGNSVKFF